MTDSSLEHDFKEAIDSYKDSLASINEALLSSPATDPDTTAQLQELRSELTLALATAEQDLHILINNNQSTPADPDLFTRPTKRPRSNPSTNNNTRIHPRNAYAMQQPDFSLLAKHHPALAPFLIPTTTTTSKNNNDSKSSSTIDFTNPEACRQLTRALLSEHFGIQGWWIPDGQLIPPVTNRLNYIHWIEDLLDLSSPSSNNSEVVGMDVGCGANLIYPLLGAAICGWKFIGVDITDVAIQWAEKNRDANPQLSDMIEVRLVDMQDKQSKFLNGGGGEEEEEEKNNNNNGGGGILSRGLQEEDGILSFSMCNPPFFSSMKQAGLNPNTAYGGTAEEMTYPGGEEAFVTEMIEDSVEVVKEKVHWYTTMVGKKGTMKSMRALLYRKGVKVVRTTEFSQGKTLRWGLAWSLAAKEETNEVALRRTSS